MSEDLVSDPASDANQADFLGQIIQLELFIHVPEKSLTTPLLLLFTLDKYITLHRVTAAFAEGMGGWTARWVNKFWSSVCTSLNQGV